MASRTAGYLSIARDNEYDPSSWQLAGSWNTLTRISDYFITGGSMYGENYGQYPPTDAEDLYEVTCTPGAKAWDIQNSSRGNYSWSLPDGKGWFVSTNAYQAVVHWTGFGAARVRFTISDGGFNDTINIDYSVAIDV